MDNIKHLISISFTPHALYYHQDNYDDGFCIRHNNRTPWTYLSEEKKQPWINLSKYVLDTAYKFL